MRDRRIDMALAFIQTEPNAAARLLERQSIEDVSGFLSNIPHAEAARVLLRMLPQHTAKICAVLDPETCAGFLSKMEVSYVAAVLRYLKSDGHDRIKELLPDKVRLACGLLLNYSEEAVGSWMIPNVSAISIDSTAGEALSQFKNDQEGINLDTVFIVDRNRELKGSASLKSILMASPQDPITSIMTQKTDALYGRATLVSARDHSGWRSRDALPVVNRKNCFVGVLRRFDLRKGMTLLARPVKPVSERGVFVQVFHAYAGCFMALADTLGKTEPSK